MNQHRASSSWGDFQRGRHEVIQRDLGWLHFLGLDLGSHDLSRNDNLWSLKYRITRQKFGLKLRRQLFDPLRSQRRTRDYLGDVVVPRDFDRVRHEDPEKAKKRGARRNKPVTGGKGAPVVLFFGQNSQFKLAVHRRHSLAPMEDPEPGSGLRTWSLHLRGVSAGGKRVQCACPLVTDFRGCSDYFVTSV